MSVPREKLLDKANNSIYKLVILAAKRAREIQAGGPILLEAPKSKQPTSIALEEIAAGLVRFKNIADDNKKEKEIDSGSQEIYPSPEDDNAQNVQE